MKGYKRFTSITQEFGLEGTLTPLWTALAWGLKKQGHNSSQESNGEDGSIVLFQIEIYLVIWEAHQMALQLFFDFGVLRNLASAYDTGLLEALT